MLVSFFGSRVADRNNLLSVLSFHFSCFPMEMDDSEFDLKLRTTTSLSPQRKRIMRIDFEPLNLSRDTEPVDDLEVSKVLDDIDEVLSRVEVLASAKKSASPKRRVRVRKLVPKSEPSRKRAHRSSRYVDVATQTEKSRVQTPQRRREEVARDEVTPRSGRRRHRKESDGSDYSGVESGRRRFKDSASQSSECSEERKSRRSRRSDAERTRGEEGRESEKVEKGLELAEEKEGMKGEVEEDGDAMKATKEASEKEEEQAGSKEEEEKQESPMMVKEEEEEKEPQVALKDEEEEKKETPRVAKEEEEKKESPRMTKEEEEKKETPRVAKEAEEKKESPRMAKEEEEKNESQPKLSEEEEQKEDIDASHSSGTGIGEANVPVEEQNATNDAQVGDKGAEVPVSNEDTKAEAIDTPPKMEEKTEEDVEKSNLVMDLPNESTTYGDVSEKTVTGTEGPDSEGIFGIEADDEEDPNHREESIREIQQNGQSSETESSREEVVDGKDIPPAVSNEQTEEAPKQEAKADNPDDADSNSEPVPAQATQKDSSEEAPVSTKAETVEAAESASQGDGSAGNKTNSESDHSSKTATDDPYSDQEEESELSGSNPESDA